MRNPLSLHSGLGSLLFLSLVPVALSLPVGGGNEWPPYGFQNHGFQSQNPNQWPPSSLQSVITQQGPNVPQHQFPQQHLWPFGNAPQLAQNPPGISSTSRILPDDEWDRFVLDSALKGPPRRESLIPPPLPSSHAGWYPSSSEARGFLEPGPSYNHAVEFRQKAEGALQRQNEPDVPPHGSAATEMRSRVSNEGASSSGTSYKPRKRIRYRYKTAEEVKKYAKLMQSRPEPEALRKFEYSASPLEEEPVSKRGPGRHTFFLYPSNAVFEDIKKIFDGKLIGVERSNLGRSTWEDHKRRAHLPSRVLPFVTFKPKLLSGGAGTIKSVRMTVHNGPKGGLQEDQAASVGSDLKGKTLYNFWGIPEGRSLGSQRIILHYGMGYIEPSEFDAVSQHLEAHLEAKTREAVAAVHLH
ncbi:uncharacterized protein UBRO_20626 [Ustilago bromivora]|uniref:Effector family protein Eff1 n=1 Tax=Ustilago bromivora TaxID=307758 RepID=A0A1K0HCL2_9BASI|nr:uncharacterized protein UBRO_20626 [Ustilago bromivora]